MMAAYDPDHVAWHPVLLSDLDEDDPEFRQRFLAENQQSGVSAAGLWDVVKSDEDEPFSGDRLAAQVDAWCAPFCGADVDCRELSAGEIDHLQRDGATGSDLVAISAESIGRVWSPDLSAVDPMLALMAETRFGALGTSEYEDESIEFPELEQDIPALVELVITGRLAPGWPVDRLKQQAGLSVTTMLEEHGGLLGLTPFGRTGTGLAKVQMGYEAPTVCVVGDTANDHALAMMCDRVFNHAAWIPLCLLRDGGELGQVVRRAGRALYRVAQRQRPVLLVSASEPREVLVEVLTELGLPTTSIGGSAKDTMRVSTVEELARHTGRRFLADVESFDLPFSIPSRRDHDGRSLLTPVAAPVPTAVRLLEQDVAWCVDVSVPGHQAPAKVAVASSALAPVVQGRWSETRVRAGRHGLSFRSVNMGFVVAGASMHARMAKPLLRFPSAEVIFTELAAKHDARIQRSAAGQRAANCVEQWGSLDSALEDLSGCNRHLLDAFIPPRRSTRGAYVKGYAIRGRGFLTLEQAVDALGSTESQARDTVDELLANRVLRRGLLLNCERCAAVDFYSVGQLTDVGFVCRSCERDNRLSRGRWYKAVSEPQWYYSLDQVVATLLEQNGDVPLLAFRELSRDKRHVHWAPELEVCCGEHTAEIDIAAIIDGTVVVGEAKSNSKLSTAKKSTDAAVTRFVSAARVLGADHIVLATTESKWSGAVVPAVNEAVAKIWTNGPLPLVSELTNLRPSKPNSSTSGPDSFQSDSSLTNTGRMNG